MTLKEIEKALQDILSASEQRKAEYQRMIESASQGEREAIVKATEAYKSGDVTAYHKAQDQIRQCSDAVNMFSTMLKDENEKPLLTEEQYQQYIGGITSVLDESTKTARSKVVKLLNDLITVSEKNGETIEAGNDLLYTLQHEVMKDDAGMTNQAGIRVWMPHLEKKYTDLEIASLKDTILNNWLFKKLNGKTE